MERTLIILKPDTLQRGIAGEILTRIERVGLKIIAAKMLGPDYDHYYHHYETISKMISRRGQEVFDTNLAIMQAGPVIALVLEGVEAVDVVRKMVGTTEPKTAQPGTIRGDYAHVSFNYANKHAAGVPNLIHASGNIAEANQEIKHWFTKNELFDYEVLHERFTQVKPTNTDI
ncbi:MAG TPA: nucleoside-diphosphate kinase [Candidatus Dormibacteraeota bacterium]|nr:nucleoside-diphosphate kinase [Candidatus Dormibacteraeota bacterium]